MQLRISAKEVIQGDNIVPKMFRIIHEVFKSVESFEV